LGKDKILRPTISQLEERQFDITLLRRKRSVSTRRRRKDCLQRIQSRLTSYPQVSSRMTILQVGDKIPSPVLRGSEEEQNLQRPSHTLEIGTRVSSVIDE